MDDIVADAFLMVMGAIFGAVIGPIGNEVATKIFKKNHKVLGFHAALLFFMAANSIWIIGELTLELMWAGTTNELSFALGLIVGMMILFIAAYTLWLAYQQLPNQTSHQDIRFLENRHGPFALLIYANLFWLLGEVLYNLSNAMAVQLMPQMAVFALPSRIIAGLAGMAIFGLAARKMWHHTPIESFRKSNNELLRELLEKSP